MRAQSLIPLILFALSMVLTSAGHAQTISRNPLSLIMETHFEKTLSDLPVNDQIIDFCRKAPMEEACNVCMAYPPYVIYNGHENNTTILLRVIFFRQDIDPFKAAEYIYRNYHNDYIGGNISAALTDLKKLDVLEKFKSLQSGYRPSNPQPRRVLQVHQSINPLRTSSGKGGRAKKTKKVWVDPVEAKEQGTPEEATPTPYELDPIYKGRLRLEGLTRAYLNAKDPKDAESIFSQMDFSQYTVLSQDLFSRLVEKVAASNSPDKIVEFIEGLRVRYRSDPDLLQVLLKMPGDQYPEVVGAKMRLIFNNRTPVGIPYLLERLNQSSTEGRRATVMAIDQNLGYAGANFVQKSPELKAALLKVVLEGMRTESDPQNKTAYLTCLKNCFAEDSTAAEAIQTTFAEAGDLGMVEAKELVSLHGAGLTPLVIAIGHFPELKNRAIENLTTRKTPEDVQTLLRILTSPCRETVRWKKLDGATLALIRSDLGFDWTPEWEAKERIKDCYTTAEMVLTALSVDPSDLKGTDAAPVLKMFYEAPDLNSANQVWVPLAKFSDPGIIDQVKDHCVSSPEWKWKELGIRMICSRQDKQDIHFLKEQFEKTSDMRLKNVIRDTLQKMNAFKDDENKGTATPEPAAL